MPDEEKKPEPLIPTTLVTLTCVCKHPIRSRSTVAMHAARLDHIQKVHGVIFLPPGLAPLTEEPQ